MEVVQGEVAGEGRGRVRMTGVGEGGRVYEKCDVGALRKRIDEAGGYG